LKSGIFPFYLSSKLFWLYSFWICHLEFIYFGFVFLNLSVLERFYFLIQRIYSLGFVLLDLSIRSAFWGVLRSNYRCFGGQYLCFGGKMWRFWSKMVCSILNCHEVTAETRFFGLVGGFIIIYTCVFIIFKVIVQVINFLSSHRGVHHLQLIFFKEY
jgi:hypothetical protein